MHLDAKVPRQVDQLVAVDGASGQIMHFLASNLGANCRDAFVTSHLLNGRIPLKAITPVFGDSFIFCIYRLIADVLANYLVGAADRGR